jgi:hypothetical protein
MSRRRWVPLCIRTTRYRERGKTDPHLATSRSIAALSVALLCRQHRHRAGQLSLPDRAESRSVTESAA